MCAGCWHRVLEVIRVRAVGVIALLAATVGPACTGGSSSSPPGSSITTEPTRTASPAATDSPAPMISLADTSWLLNIVDGGDWPVGDAPDVTLVFGNNRLHGFSGCNSYSAKWRMVDGRIEVGRFTSTLVGCSGEVGRIEHRLFHILSASPAVGDGGVTELRLTGGRGVLVFARVLN
jgi:heat shock protein HslJ